MHYWGFDGWGWGMGMGFIMIAFWALVIVGIIYLVRYVGRGGQASYPSRETPLDILKKRYARGELSKEEYDRMKRELSE